MKIRMGFVSNSSSSSFIIKINENPKQCAACGRSTPELINFIKRCEDDETKIDKNSKEEILKDIEEDIDLTNNKIQELLKLDPNGLAPGFSFSKKPVSYWLNIFESQLKQKQERYEKIKNINGKVMRISISHHDEYADYILKEAIKIKQIEIIEEF